MDDLIAGGYLVAAVCFILGLKMLARPRTAVRGNGFGALGMLIAIVVTLTDQAIVSFTVIVAGIVLGTAFGLILATQVQMTAMPELVALFNGLGGAASTLVAAASFREAVDLGVDDGQLNSAAVLTALIGAATFSGSVIAFGKLRERLTFTGLPGNRTVLIFSLLAAFGFGGAVLLEPTETIWLWLLIAAGAIVGVLATSPIGGADMPVVIALLNSLSGVAAAMAGFVLDNSLLIVAGALVGASGLILTQIMCVAMNRTLASVLFSPAPSADSSIDPDDVYEGKVRATTPDDVALILANAARVVVVPGYGLAVAQAQHAVRDLTRALKENGTEVVFGIHPVAGRMPGHMNVLLAEAEIPYESLVEMDDVNPTLEQTDVAIVVGANDVVNPIARSDSNSVIAGMPIIDVDRARVVVVIKRSLSPGFAGVPNPLFAADNTLMLFGDGREAVLGIARAMSEV